jgi:hypothetical protein
MLIRMLVKVSILCLLVFVTLSLHTRRAEAQAGGYCGEKCVHDDTGAPGCLNNQFHTSKCVLLEWSCYTSTCQIAD